MDIVACSCILVIELRTDTKMERLTGFLVSWSFLESRTFATKAQFDQVLLLKLATMVTFTTDFYDSFHVRAFSTDESPSNLEFFFILDLNVETTCILNILINSSR